MEKLDLTKILKDCPSGTKLYSPIYGTVVFERVNEGTNFPIETNKCVFTADGRYCLNGEQMLFPSNDQRDWSKWSVGVDVFSDGDFCVIENLIFIYKSRCENLIDTYAYIETKGNKVAIGGIGANIRLHDKKVFFATDGEKNILLDYLCDRDYVWDAEKRELKKIEPKFDISTLQPFDRVLVRCNDGCDWVISLFSYIDETREFGMFVCNGGGAWEQCVPYNEETKHLLGASQQAPEKYIKWE